MPQQSTAVERFQALTWDDLEAWAGKTTVSRGRSYQRNRQVQGLAQTPSGGTLAWVQGTSRYATRVADDDEDIDDTDGRTPQWSRHTATGTLHTFLTQHTREQLIALLEELAERHPAVRETLLDRHELATGAVPELVQAVLHAPGHSLVS
jgi:uncharacterized Zn finger protein